MIQSPKWIFEQFCNIFPQFGSEENITYYPRGNNTIKCEFKNPNYPTLLFSYTNKRDWKIITEKRYSDEEESIEKLREALSIEQKKTHNIRRSERRHKNG